MPDQFVSTETFRPTPPEPDLPAVDSAHNFNVKLRELAQKIVEVEMRLGLRIVGVVEHVGNLNRYIDNIEAEVTGWTAPLEATIPKLEATVGRLEAAVAKLVVPEVGTETTSGMADEERTAN